MGVVTGVYAIIFILVFEAWPDSALILSIPIVGLSGWFYGTRGGLFAIALLILLNTAILFLVSGSSDDIRLTYNPTAIVLAVVVVLTTGHMRKSQKKLNQLRSSLSDRVAEATCKLDQLTQHIIQQDEKERIEIGQDFHDGVGQHLTGMLLHCEALSLNLAKESRSEAALAEKMTQRIRSSMEVVRQLSRAQLPLRTAETTLEAALEELTEYFGEVSSADFCLELDGDSSNLPPVTAQHLYRIMHEAIYRAVYKYRAKKIDLRLIARTCSCVIHIGATDLVGEAPLASELISKIMQYRIQTLGGTFTYTPSPAGGFLLECRTVFKKEVV